MSYSIPAISMNGTISAEQSLLAVYQDRVVEKRNTSLTADVDVNKVVLDWKDSWEESEPHKPYLLIKGRVKAIRGDFPFNINEVTLSGDNIFDVEMIYDFDDYEVATLVTKGLFERDFVCPHAFYEETLKDLPIRCNYKVLEPVLPTDVPLVFMDVVDAFDIHLTTRSCGYRFSDAFEMSKLHQIRLNEMTQQVVTEKQFTSTVEKLDEVGLNNVGVLVNDKVFETQSQTPVDEPTKADLDYVNKYLSIYSETKSRIESKRPTLYDILNKITEDKEKTTEDAEDVESEEQLEDNNIPAWMLTPEYDGISEEYEDEYENYEGYVDDIYGYEYLEEDMIDDTDVNGDMDMSINDVNDDMNMDVDNTIDDTDINDNMNTDVNDTIDDVEIECSQDNVDVESVTVDEKDEGVITSNKEYVEAVTGVDFGEEQEEQSQDNDDCGIEF